MGLLRPSTPPQLAGNHFSRLPSFNLGFPLEEISRSNATRLPEIVEEGGGGDIVHVSVGKSIHRSVELLHWTFRQFENREVGLVYVHQLSPTIPTLLGKLPASHANEESVVAYRRVEREQSHKLLSNYLNICSKAKVKTSIFTIESGHVPKGIVELVDRHTIRKLVMGATSCNCMKVKKSTSNANYATKNAPPFCEIWFVNKGKHVWTREASEDLNMFIPMLGSVEHPKEERLRSKSAHSHESEQIINPTFLRFNSYPTCGGVSNWIQEVPDQLGVALSANGSSFMARITQSESSPNSSMSASGYTSAELKALSEFGSKLEEECYYNKILEARTEAETSKNESFSELLKRRRLESKCVEALNKAKDFEAAHAREVQLRKEVDDMLRSSRQEREKLLEQRKDLSRELQRTMRDVAVLDSCVNETNRRQNEAANKLKLIQMSLTTLQRERENMHRQKKKATRQLEWWRAHGQARTSCCGGFSFVNNSAEYTQFSLFDLQTATCNFSNSFIIGQGSYSCVYKGEIFDRSVAIKKLHPLHMEGTSEFQEEVEVLSKLKHPCLVTLIGACPEEWCLVYEYMSNGSIQDHLFRRIDTPLTWKTRTHVVADIASALLYLHSSEPQKIIHGDLKPENILLDSAFKCKIGDFRICQLVTKKTARCPSFRGITEMKSAFPYIDPELQTPEDSTPKSDIYAFGLIILQLLTGRSPVGLANEVRRAVICGDFLSILDPSAGEWPTFVARRLVELGLQCCELKSCDRPELKPALVKELEKLHLTEEKPVPSFFLCPILKDLMHDPHVAADGFTYEGDALRGWLNNGHETSPMTNLTLSHLHLTPNHTLRLAIQDWFCQS